MMNRLLSACVKRKHFDRARKVFDEMPLRDVVTYNILISGIMSLGFIYFKRMLSEKIRPDEITLNVLLRSCCCCSDSELGDTRGQQTHSFLVKLGFGSNCFVASAVVDMYAKIGFPADARMAFDEVARKDLVLWNVMVSCYALNGLAWEACQLYNVMRSDGVDGDGYTICSLLSCGFVGSCDLAKQLHCVAVKLSYDSDLLVASALVDMYVKNGGVGDGRRAFDAMSCRNVITWNTMIVGYGREGDGNRATKLLREMWRTGIVADEVTLASVLSSCGRSSSAKELAQVHCLSIKGRLDVFPSISNSLVSAYSKCGSLADARQCFGSMLNPDLISWTSLINACWTNGDPEQAINVFEEMISNGVEPDHIAFLSILTACSHGGLLAQGLHYINLMSTGYGMKPNQDHYTCLVDLLSRSGSLDEALVVLSSMPLGLEHDALVAFVGACRIHGRINLAKMAAEKLHQLEPDEPATRALLSSIHASNEDWSRAGKIRNSMDNNINYKIAGCSSVI